MIERLLPPAVPQVHPVNARVRESTSASFRDVLKADSKNAVTEPTISSEKAADEGSETPPHLFEFHIQHASGDIEVFALPWTLSATAGLAQSIAMGHLGSLESSVMTSSFECSGTSGSSTNANELDAQLIVSNPSAAEPNTTAGISSLLASEPVELRAGKLDAATATSPATIMPWAERLIRWVQQQGSGASVWVRDYRLDDEAARQLGEAMKSVAREHGIAIQKIVVNAREIWRSSATNGS
jgi:hypothetical protein